MEKIKDRFLRYVAVDTQSKDGEEQVPSTNKQFKLAEMLVNELKNMGAEDVRLSDHCYVTATIPANNGESAPVIGLIAHMDTSDAASGADIRPVITEQYDGTPIRMSDTKYLDPSEFPSLLRHIGETVICTDGTTLLGADDKAGVAEIMQAAELLLKEDAPKHGTVRIAFTPDEEVGRGVDYLDVNRFAADFAYTVDGGDLGDLSYECFNAAGAEILIDGVSIHPGEAKGKMKNSLLIGMELHSMLPVFMNPAATEKREGFFHLDRMNGSVERTVMKYIVRDHDRKLFEEKKKLLISACEFMNEKYGHGTVTLNLKDSYYNMIEVMDMEVVNRAIRAMKAVGIEPVIEPIRGGTDGARLSFMGLPCPNLCAGGNNFHGPYEFVTVETMEKITELLVELVTDR
ncbi:MAG: peptidase T [Clostridia bacterium]|nr:peptidase T [Clostridia bacterium]